MLSPSPYPIRSTIAKASTTVACMNSPKSEFSLTWPVLAWLTVVLAGAVIPAISLMLLVDPAASEPLAQIGGPILALALMGAGIIGASAAGRFAIGLCLALAVGAALILLAGLLGASPMPSLLPIALVFLIASISFAARGALFATSSAGKGWWIAVFVVAGEAAILLTAIARPGALPDLLLALLPAQWANMAIQNALGGASVLAAIAPLIALGGTAAATALVTYLWPRRWPYLIMFSTWLALSALVWHWPVAA